MLYVTTQFLVTYEISLFAQQSKLKLLLFQSPRRILCSSFLSNSYKSKKLSPKQSPNKSFHSFKRTIIFLNLYHLKIEVTQSVPLFTQNKFNQ